MIWKEQKYLTWSTLEMKIESLLRQLFPDAEFDPEDPLLEMGSFPEWDSLGNLNFLMLIEETCDVRFTADDMAELKSMKAIKARLAELGVQA